MRSEEIKVNVLFSLFWFYEEMKTGNVIGNLNPDGFINQIGLLYRLNTSSWQTSWEEADLVIPGMVTDGLIEKKQFGMETRYKITFKGMKEYERIEAYYPRGRKDIFIQLIRELEAPEPDNIQQDKLDVLKVLYTYYREKAHNPTQWHEMFQNYEGANTYKVVLVHHSMKLNTEIEKVLEKLYDEGHADRIRGADTFLRYRISRKGIRYYEKYIEDTTGEPASTDVAALWAPPKEKKSTVPPKTHIKKGKIFISHAVKNKTLSVSFQEMILETGLHVKPDEIFNVSVEGSGITSGEHFKERIEHELKKARAIILLITPEYKESGACLNEMGAAWMMASQIPVIPFILGLEHTAVGFIHNPTQHLQLNDRVGLLQFVTDGKEREIFDNTYNIGRLDRKINEFIEVANTVPKPPPPAASKKTPKAVSNKGSAKILYKYFKEGIPKDGSFFQINNHGTMYIFSQAKFHVMPGSYSHIFYGLKKGVPVTPIQIEDNDLGFLIGEPMKNVFDLPVFKTPDSPALWVIYNDRRYRVVGEKLISQVKPENIQMLPQSELDRIIQGDMFALPN